MSENNEAGWSFDNSYSRLPSKFFHLQNPEPVPSPSVVVFNDQLAKSLGLNIDAVKDQAEVFSGNQVPDGAKPLAQAYAGHQFGHFNKLGDGRAILLGEQKTPDGERFDIQLKGAGRTPYSRGGDGRAALGPMLREYLISEAMHALGIPTTRSLAVVTTGEAIQRETLLPGAILTRVASSHIRVGTFQYAARFTSMNDLRILLDYTIKRHYPHLKGEKAAPFLFLQEVIKRQASLVAKWQLVGFIHGVMNTDNMAISGETIDYGPCAFMDTFNPATVFSSIDREGRYSYGNQPYMAAWNLARLAESLLPFLSGNQEEAVKLAEEAINKFGVLYNEFWYSGMRKKLGLIEASQENEQLIKELLELMRQTESDYTNTFRGLTLGELEGLPLYSTGEFKKWHERWQETVNRQEGGMQEALAIMKKANPTVIPRNHRVEEALEVAVEHQDYSKFKVLLDILSDPYGTSALHKEYSKLPEQTDMPYQTFCGT